MTKSAALISTPLTPPDTHLAGRWPVIGRIAWMLFAVMALAYFAAEASYTYTELLQPADLLRANLAHLGLPVEAHALYLTSLRLVFMLVHLLIAGLIVWRKAQDRMALIVAFVLLLMGTSIWPFPPVAYPAAWYWPRAAAQFLSACLFITFFYIFPDGRFTPRWTRPLTAVLIVLEVGLYFLRGTPFDASTWPRIVSTGISIGVLGSMLYAQVYRYRRVSSPTLRQQTKWVVFGVVVTLTGYFLIALPGALNLVQPAPGSAYGLIAGSGIALTFLCIPLSIGIASLRYRLWDIDPIINRTLVYGALTALVIGIYVLIVGALSAAFRAQGNLLISVLATGAAAILFEPLRARLQRAVNRLMYGERDDPYTVISRLGQRLEATLAPEAVLPTIVETVRDALKLPYVAIVLRRGDDFEVAASAGEPAAAPIIVPLMYQAETLGHLRLAPRAPGEDFSPADRRLLTDLAHQAGLAAHAVRLTADLQRLNADLQRSREQLVAAREEERRRLRRDLHDGLGPALVNITLQLEAAHDQLAHDPVRAQTMLNRLIVQAQAAIGDIRRLVYDLRPPVLDELGLVSAIREQAAQYANSGLHVTLSAPEPMPPLLAAVEVAAYRIAQEALTNVVRHAQARHCAIILAIENDLTLRVEISDDGRGLTTQRKAGVGLNSMRERAEELGGALTIDSPLVRGTRVMARLPLNLPSVEHPY